MSVIYKQKAPRLLNDAQKKAKLQKDSEYEIAHMNLSADFKAGRLTKAQFDITHPKQWNDYFEWAKANGLYEEVTETQQATEAEDVLNFQLGITNQLRAEAGIKPPLKIVPVA